jgi:predicted Fe-S protein YdhL (DUF1289 family)
MVRKDRIAQALARKRWDKVSAEERREIGRRLSAAAAAARTERARQRREAAAQAEAEVA